MVTFLLALRKSSWGLIFGLLTHLIILLGRYLFPVQRESSKGNVIYLQGELMFPSSDVSCHEESLVSFERTGIFQSLSQKLQKNGGRLPDNSKFIIDFEKVLAIDSGAAFGLTDGILFVAESNPTLSIELCHIQVNLSFSIFER